MSTGMKFSLGWNFFHVIVKFILYWIYRGPGLKFHPGLPGWNFIPGWKPPCNWPLKVIVHFNSSVTYRHVSKQILNFKI
jgi:hypothetical protein